MFEEQIRFLREMSKRTFAQQILNFLMIVCSALILWKTLSLYTNSESPIVVVLSGSMEPAFYRGDILFLSMPNEPVKVGDNNQVDDRGLYNKNQAWIHKEHLIGKVNGFLPYVGIITIAMNDYPQLKYLLIIALAIYVLINRE
nr:15577_t:CDS:2 [Entrophospora candida]